jgi:hypothetical protein
MSTRLIQTLAFSGVPAAGQASLPHSINIAGRALVPDFVAVDNGDFRDGIIVTSTTVTVTNNGSAPADCNVWLEYKHTIQRAFGAVQTTSLVPNPFIAAASAGGGSGELSLAARRTIHVLMCQAGIIGATIGEVIRFSQSRLFAGGGQDDDVAPADFTGRQLDPATGTAIVGAGTPDAVGEYLQANGFPAGNHTVTGADATLWIPGGGDPFVFFTNGGYGNAMSADALSSTITFAHENAGSIATNRFNLPGGVDIVLAYGEAIAFRYEALRWVPVIAS